MDDRESKDDKHNEYEGWEEWLYNFNNNVHGKAESSDAYEGENDENDDEYKEDKCNFICIHIFYNIYIRALLIILQKGKEKEL
jgi:hypothetical protein